MARIAESMLQRYFPEYERKHIHLEVNESGASLFSSVVQDLLSFQEEGRLQVPMGYYRKKKREFPGPRTAWKNLQVAANVRRELSSASLHVSWTGLS